MLNLDRVIDIIKKGSKLFSNSDSIDIISSLLIDLNSKEVYLYSGEGGTMEFTNRDSIVIATTKFGLRYYIHERDNFYECGLSMEHNNIIKDVIDFINSISSVSLESNINTLYSIIKDSKILELNSLDAYVECHSHYFCNSKLYKKGNVYCIGLNNKLLSFSTLTNLKASLLVEYLITNYIPRYERICL